MTPARITRSAAVVLTAAAVAAATAQQTRPSAPPEKPKRAFVVMSTSMGEIVLELNRDKAPVTVENFLSYAEREFYDGTIFHRVIDGFMIQRGGLTPDLKKKPTEPPIANEWGNGLTNQRGTIAMARGPEPDSATSQFFINVVDNPRLDQPISGGAGYAVFGRVAAGMDVVDEIRQVDTGMKAGRRNVPIEPVVIEKIRQVPPEEARKRIEAEQAPATQPQSDG